MTIRKNKSKFKNIRNKRGEGIVGNQVVNLIFAAIAIFIILYFVRLIYLSFITEDIVKRAETQLEKVNEVIKRVWEVNGKATIDFFPPRGWFLRTFPDYNFPDGECRDNSIISCVCLCEDLTCRNPQRRKCEGFSFEVKVDETLEKFIQTGSGGISGGSQGVSYPEVIELVESTYDLYIFKENDIVRIRSSKEIKEVN